MEKGCAVYERKTSIKAMVLVGSQRYMLKRYFGGIWGMLTFATVGETIPWPGLPSIFPGCDIEVLVRVDVPRTVKGENVSGVVDVL